MLSWPSSLCQSVDSAAAECFPRFNYILAPSSTLQWHTTLRHCVAQNPDYSSRNLASAFSHWRSDRTRLFLSHLLHARVLLFSPEYRMVVARPFCAIPPTLSTTAITNAMPSVTRCRIMTFALHCVGNNRELVPAKILVILVT